MCNENNKNAIIKPAFFEDYKSLASLKLALYLLPPFSVDSNQRCFH